MSIRQRHYTNPPVRNASRIIEFVTDRKIPRLSLWCVIHFAVFSAAALSVLCFFFSSFHILLYFLLFNLPSVIGLILRKILVCRGGGHVASTEREAITGGLGRAVTWVKFIPSHLSFILKSNSENCIKIRWFLRKLQTKISWFLFYGCRCIRV